MEKFDFIEYMLACARELKDVLHSETQQRFFRVTGVTQMEELLFNLPDASYPAIMVENNRNGTLSDRSPSDNYMDMPYYSFMVIDKAGFNDHDLVESAKEKCKAIGMKVISRMVRDKRLMTNGLTFLNVSGIAYTTFGPVADNTYGVSFSFTVPDRAEIGYTPSDWQS
jgi:hypothetical protein